MKKIAIGLIVLIVVSIVVGFIAIKPVTYHGYTDIKDDEVGNSMLTLVDMGILNSDGQQLSPDKPVTIGQYTDIVQNMFNISIDVEGNPVDIASGEMITQSLMATLGLKMSLELYTLSQMDEVKRGEFCVLLLKLVPNYIGSSSATTQQSYSGTLVLNTPDFVLKNATVHGDLVIAAGVGESTVTLDNVYVDGRLVLIGIAFEQIVFLNESEITGSIVNVK